jgi:ATPase subunit of ABC transporter with duplicated ATPase domains
MASSLSSVVQSQLIALDDTDCYATAWQEALEKSSADSQKVHWGGRGHGGRGLARRTFQPKDCIVEDVRLEYVGDSRVLLEKATLKLLSARVYCLIGRNGSGKSTLLRRIDAGRIPGFPPHFSTMYVPREDDASLLHDCVTGDDNFDESTPMQLLLRYQQAYSKKSATAMQEEIKHLEIQMDQLDMDLAEDQFKMEDLATQISNMEDEMHSSSVGDDKDLREAFRFVGMNDENIWSAPMSSLSSGLRKRVLLALPLVCRSDLLLLDEPTNGLDVEGLLMLRRLIEFCSSKRQTTVLVVSHDHDLIDSVADDVIDFFERNLLYFPGNYSEYRRYRQTTTIHQLRQAVALEKKRAAMMKTLENLIKMPTPKRGGAKKKGKQIGSHRKKIERQGLEKDEKGHRRTNQTAGTGVKPGSINALDASTRKALTTNQLLFMSRNAVKPPPEKVIQFVFRDVASRWNEPVIMALDIGHGFNVVVGTSQRDNSRNVVDKVSMLPVITKKDGCLFDCVDLCVQEGEKYCIVGSLASGKSTLLKILSKLVQPIEGQVKYAWNLDVAFIDQRQINALVESTPDDKECAISYLSKLFPQKTEHAIRGELTAFGLSPEQATTGIRFLSGGERCRLCLASAMLRDPHVLLLDEPTSNLDVESVDALVYGLSRWNGTVVVVSHDMNFVRSLNAKCYALIAKEGKLRRVEGGIDAYLRAFG